MPKPASTSVVAIAPGRSSRRKRSDATVRTWIDQRLRRSERERSSQSVTATSGDPRAPPPAGPLADCRSGTKKAVAADAALRSVDGDAGGEDAAKRDGSEKRRRAAGGGARAAPTGVHPPRAPRRRGGGGGRRPRLPPPRPPPAGGGGAWLGAARAGPRRAGEGAVPGALPIP